MASCPDSDNSWVLAGSEGLPVETLGPESSMAPEPEWASQAPRSRAEAAAEQLAGAVDGEEAPFQSESPRRGPILPEKPEAEGVPEGDSSTMKPPGPGDTVVQGDSEEAPVVAGLEDTEDPEGHSPPRSLPSSPGAARPAEETRCSSSEDDVDMGVDVDVDVDVEGLRRRRGQEPSTPQPAAALGVEGQARGEGAGGQLGISFNTCLLAALVLLGLGVLLFSGGLPESDSGPSEEAQLQVFPDAVLDAEDGLGQGLQASASPDSVPGLQNMALLLDKLAKENQDIRLLQAQLQAQKEELRSLSRQPRELEEENARLRAALQRGEASQQALEAELRRLRARLQGLEADCVRGPDGVCVGWAGGSPGSGAPREQQELEAEAQAWRRELERQRQLLGAVRQDLEQSLRAAGRGDLAELGRRLARQLQGLEKRDRRPGAAANASEARHPEPRVQSPSERSGKEEWREGQGERNAEPWKHRKDGSGGERALGVELAPVRRQELAALLTAYLARLPWAGPLTQELPLSPAFFGEDGIFRHDRLRFRDFVDALEDSLEEVAVRQTGDDDEVDDFEGFIFNHFFGEKAPKKRPGKKDRHFRRPGRG
ncbi:pre-B-cell leukemia transcription factor-interacting protein 1 [Suricata suricatta]|uniref:pre-B-cell leukemia transcription factor-interacting protein 1 n=1 Tax=Suricata suricatta TaxID=37032 RepID=UPI001155DCDA|nr:pre-B-cell leukemia transcription factor-interacting protein 1 [Suricata suricatta]